MKVYKIATGYPPGAKRREYARLNPKDRDGSFLSKHIGNGKPCSGWKPMELYFFNPSAPKPDIFCAPSLVFNQRTCDLLKQSLESCGQLLPLTVKEEAGTHYLYNCTTVVDALDSKRSIWEYDRDLDHSDIDVPSFHPERFKDVTLFLLPPRQLPGLYVVERTGNPRDGEFKALVEQHDLTGLRFDLLWSDTDGPALPRFLHEPDSPFEHRTADGKPWVFNLPRPATSRPATTQAKPTPRSRQASGDDPKQAEGKTPPPIKSSKRLTVFQLQPVIPAKNGRQQTAPMLECSPSAKLRLTGERFRGQPFPDNWRRVELHFGDRSPWRADFYGFGPGALVCSERAKDALAPLEDEGEFLPVRLRGIPGRHFLFNSTNCRSYLNPKLTEWKAGGAQVGRRIAKHSFWASRVGEDCHFKVPEEGAVEHYSIERTGDPYDDEFRAIVQAEGLTGLRFRKVWSGGPRLG